MLGDGSYLLPSSWGRDGIEFVTLFIGYVGVLVVRITEDEPHAMGVGAGDCLGHIVRSLDGFCNTTNGLTARREVFRHV